VGVSRRVWLINASAYRPIGRYRRYKHRKSMTQSKLVADTPLRQITLTLNPNFAQTMRHSQPEIYNKCRVIFKDVSDFLCSERRKRPIYADAVLATLFLVSLASGVGDCRVSLVDLGGKLLRPPTASTRRHDNPAVTNPIRSTQHQRQQARRNDWPHGVVISGVRRENEVTLRRARLVMGWVIVFGWVYHLSL